MPIFRLFKICLFACCVSNVCHGQDASSEFVLDYMPPKDAERVAEILPDARLLKGGIRFVETKAGSGPKFKKGDTVTALYVGKFLDGRIFNQKQSRYHNFRFEVGADPREIIEGWEIAMPLMQNGGEYTVAVPSQFAYKDKGRAGQVPPYTTVMFDIQIIDWEAAR
ncbi:FKBP-type peptidyl-prolyl cis-trans isomerase [Pelagicoccus mobilis]|uniref:Peptidyl-prolyl cis-trans isomerase n=1 Tax=Pelagicoccus mobilis TaxID=415221 RepID=A0A934S1V5_9BACT|nr:FKBP-type peptidyl-prolyl cis-trans isomerase [Pelagicoccus mobilis]MBK1879630.1 FKBP-type peptidyl-prolyl cis-trans isomerase [Pelagicoccus mobilis]